jgi:uncharacterized membrane protein YczE
MGPSLRDWLHMYRSIDGNMDPMLARRLVQLYGGLVLYGISAAFILLAAFGADPWDVFHQGLSRRTGIGTGIWVCIVGALVLLLWIPLRQRPGIGTLSNVVVIGLVMEAMLTVFEPAGDLPIRIALLVSGVVLNGVAIGLYIGAAFGPGPRDGLMTGLAARGHSIRVVRTGIELTVLAAGAALGGTVGVGTVFYALAIGPLAHIFVPMLAVPSEPEALGARGPRPAHAAVGRVAEAARVAEASIPGRRDPDERVRDEAA